MAETGSLFLNNILTNNIVFISLWGIVLLILEADNLRKSYIKGMKISAGLLISMLLGWIFSAWFGGQLHVDLLLFWLSSFMGIFFLYQTGVLHGDWQNMPRIVVALAPFTGIQWSAFEQGVAYFERIYVIGGVVVGFYLAFVLTAAVREQLKISELPQFLRKEPLLLITMGFFALALLGFGFI